MHAGSAVLPTLNLSRSRERRLRVPGLVDAPDASRALVVGVRQGASIAGETSQKSPIGCVFGGAEDPLRSTGSSWVSSRASGIGDCSFDDEGYVGDGVGDRNGGGQCCATGGPLAK